MRLLLTSDTQSEFSNLAECEQALAELLEAAKEYEPDAIINAGDLKDAYNPVDMRVVKFHVRATRQIVTNYRYIILRGNHDRISQDVDSKDWLDVLRAAGAETVSYPKIKHIGDGNVAFLPFTPDKKQERQWAKGLAARSIGTGPHILIFHTELQGAYVAAGRFGTGNTQKQLCMEKYDMCFGGHLHMHHNVGAADGRDSNVAYIGSPFCMDWGEADQTKGHVLYDSKNGCYEQIKTKIPHWYNAETLEQRKAECTVCNGAGKVWRPATSQESDLCPACTPEPGAYIRSKVLVSSKKISTQLKEEEGRLSQLYAGARLFVIPRLEPKETAGVVITGDSDKDSIAQYVAATIPEAANFASIVAVGYLVNCLKTIDPGARGKQLRVLKLVGRNALSFKKVVIRYHNQGLVLLKGKNLDWPKRSNGAGKTNALSLLPAALCGQTLKGQKNDQLANEDLEGPCLYTLHVRDAKKRKIEIVRGRHPHRISMAIDGVDVSTGLSGKGKKETQGQIEDELGFDFRLLINSIYIDQTIANGFLYGTQKDRMDLVNKLLDLDRFDAALKVVSKDIDKNQKHSAAETIKATNLEDERDNLEQELSTLQNEKEHNWADQLNLAVKELQRCITAKAAIAASADFYKDVRRDADAIWANYKQQEVDSHAFTVEEAYIEKRIKTIDKLTEQGRCTVCRRKVSATLPNTRAKLAKRLSVLGDKLFRMDTSISVLQDSYDEKVRSISEFENQLEDADSALNHAKAIHLKVETGAKEEEKRNERTNDKIRKISKDLRHTKRILRASRSAVKDLNTDLELLVFSQKAFKRSGLPMYLAQGLCPLLNRAAEEYAEIFNNSKLQIRFDVVDGEFVADIINSAGSKTTEGQSVGESAMAGVITAFALREAAPKTNLVIVDEPGTGLDEEGQRQFANGLLQLKDRWSTIIITTHSRIIESILSGEKIWTVIKKDKISRLKT